jgi:hypothetical protein
MPSYTTLKIKAYIVAIHPWTTLEGAPWDAKKDGFAFAKSAGAEGIKGETLRTWYSNYTERELRPKTKSINNLVSFINTYLSVESKFDASHFDDRTSVKDFCQILGYTDQQTITIVYHYLYLMDGPHLDYLISGSDTRSIAMSRGLYVAYRRESEGEITSLGIAVVGTVPASGWKTERRKCIFARMSVPSRFGGEAFKYNGILSVKWTLTTWNFLQERSSMRDVAFLMTSRGDVNRDDFRCDGHMVTMRQSGNGGSSISYPIAVCRVTTKFEFDDIERHLDKNACFNTSLPDGIYLPSS